MLGTINHGMRNWINKMAIVIYYTKEDGRKVIDGVYADIAQYVPMTRLHRENGPAIKLNYGKWWYLNGKLHRIGGPAIKYNDGTKWWYRHNRTYRDDGPSHIDSDGKCNWWLPNGELKSEEIEAWIKEKGLPHWSEWDNNIKMLFKLVWC